MKKTLISFIAAVLFAAALSAQNLAENEFYLKSLDLETQAAEAFDTGDYDGAADYAAQAGEYADMSDAYVAKMLALRAAEMAIGTAQDRFDWATALAAERRFPDKYAAAGTELTLAKESFAAENFQTAREHAELVLPWLEGVKEEAVFPAQYTVKSLDLDTDCLWRIAAQPFVYNDGLKWPLLFKANSSKLQDPGNADLIQPGIILSIPPIAGERRVGLYDPAKKYPVFSAK